MVSLELINKIKNKDVKGSVPITSKRDLAKTNSCQIIDEAVE